MRLTPNIIYKILWPNIKEMNNQGEIVTYLIFPQIMSRDFKSQILNPSTTQMMEDAANRPLREMLLWHLQPVSLFSQLSWE